MRRTILRAVFAAAFVFSAGFSLEPAIADENAVSSTAVLTESSDGVPIAVTIAGNPDGKELLFIHGYMSSTLNWEKQLHSDLAKTHKLVFVDMRGHGSSGKPWDRDSYLNTQLFADDIAVAIEAAELKKPLLVAWSYGALFLMDYIRHYGTGNVAGIALVSSDGGLLPAPPPPEPTPEYQERIERSRSVNVFVIREWTNGLIDYFGRDTELPPNDIEILRLSAMLVPHHVRRFMRDRPVENGDLAGDIDVPVLFIAGAEDGSVKSGGVAKAAEKIARSEVELYDGLGTMIFWHAPERFSNDIAAFSKRVQ